jgi:hypothetical protein
MSPMRDQTTERLTQSSFDLHIDSLLSIRNQAMSEGGCPVPRQRPRPRKNPGRNCRDRCRMVPQPACLGPCARSNGGNARHHRGKGFVTGRQAGRVGPFGHGGSASVPGGGAALLYRAAGSGKRPGNCHQSLTGPWHRSGPPCQTDATTPNHRVGLASPRSGRPPVVGKAPVTALQVTSFESQFRLHSTVLVVVCLPASGCGGTRGEAFCHAKVCGGPDRPAQIPGQGRSRRWYPLHCLQQAGASRHDLRYHVISAQS